MSAELSERVKQGECGWSVDGIVRIKAWKLLIERIA